MKGLLVALAGTSVAMAAPITLPTELVGPQTLIDFNSLAVGSHGSSLVLSGVTFTGTLNAKSTAGYGAPTTYPTFVSGIALDGLPVNSQGAVFTITFGADVAQVGFGLWDPNFAGNLIKAFDSAGNLLETTAPDALFPTGGSGADYVGFVRGVADIRRIEITAGVLNGVSDGLWVDNLSFSATPVGTPVSIPGTLLLTATGLLGVAAARRRIR